MVSLGCTRIAKELQSNSVSILGVIADRTVNQAAKDWKKYHWMVLAHRESMCSICGVSISYGVHFLVAIQVISGLTVL